MDVMNMPKTILPNIEQLKKDFSDFLFAEDEVFHWSPKINTVYYNPRHLSQKNGIFQLLHELGHALCGHTTFGSGVQLLRMEAEAWAKAQETARHYGLKIDQQQVDRCLDTYRDWLHLRSVCPTCKTVAVEVNTNMYRCFNCSERWLVPKDQRSRRYRLKVADLRA